jgi:hypothetical protein
VLTEVMTGRVDFYAPVSAALGFIRDGELLALSVSSAQRSAALRTCRPRSKRLSQFGFQFLDRGVRAEVIQPACHL